MHHAALGCAASLSAAATIEGIGSHQLQYGSGWERITRLVVVAQGGQHDQVLVPGELPHGAGPLVSHATSTGSTTSTMQPTSADISQAAAGLTATPLTSILEQKVAAEGLQPTMIKPAAPAIGTAAMAPAGYTDMSETGTGVPRERGIVHGLPVSAAGVGGIGASHLGAAPTTAGVAPVTDSGDHHHRHHEHGKRRKKISRKLKGIFGKGDSHRGASTAVGAGEVLHNQNALML